MTFEFKPAKRENVRLIIGLAGGTGSGKTFSAMEMAEGIAGPGGKFAVIDTENGRAKHYADRFKFDHGDLDAPFSPDRYIEALEAADRAGYPVVVVDSMSHEWSGEDGVLDWQESELDRMAGQDWKKREACKMAAWIKPKLAHKSMVQRLLRLRCHVILCFRAEEKTEMVKQDNKWVMVPKKTLTSRDGWLPVTEKNLPFELTTSFLLTSDAPGMPKPIKLQEQHMGMFPLDKPLNHLSGKLIAAWAAGGDAMPTKKEVFSVQAVVSAFAAHNVTQDDLVARLGHAISQDDRAILQSWRRALLDGEAWPSQVPVGSPVSGDPSGAQASAGGL